MGWGIASIWYIVISGFACPRRCTLNVRQLVMVKLLQTCGQDLSHINLTLRQHSRIQMCMHTYSR